MKSPKILLVTLDFPPLTGGVARYLSSVCYNLPASDLVVAANIHKDANVFDNTVNYKIIRCQMLKPKLKPQWLGCIWDFYKIIKKQKINHIIVGNVLPLGTVIYYLQKILKFKYSVIVHGMDVALAMQIKRKAKMAFKIYNKADVIFANSEFSKQLVVKQGIKAEKVMVINPGVDLIDEEINIIDNWQQQHNLANKQILFSLARLVERKGFDNTLKALPAVLKQYPDLVYVIAGDGPYKSELEKIINDLNLQESVLMVGRVSEEQKHNWLQVADIFVMPSRQIDDYDIEGFGIVYLEANFFAKPVIGGNSGGVAEAVLDNQTGLLCDPNSVEDIASKIIDLLANPAKAEMLGKNGQQRVLESFNWQDLTEKIIKNLD